MNTGIISLPDNMEAKVYNKTIIYKTDDVEVELHDKAIFHKPELYRGLDLSFHDCTYISRLKQRISDGKFNWKKYIDKKSYFGREIQTRALFASYGQIGYIVSIPILDGDSSLLQLEYDWEMNKFDLHY